MSEEKKLNLKLEDVRLKGCSLTMGVAAENLGLSSKLCISLLEVLHYQGNYILMSGNFQKKVHEVSFFEEVSDIQEFLDGGLIEKVDNHEYQLRFYLQPQKFKNNLFYKDFSFPKCVVVKFKTSDKRLTSYL